VTSNAVQPPGVDLNGFHPSAGWEDLMSVLMAVTGTAAAALIAFCVGVWLLPRLIGPPDPEPDRDADPAEWWQPGERADDGAAL